MVNLASRTIDEHKNVLLTQSKKIKKSPFECKTPAKILARHSLLAKPLIQNVPFLNINAHFLGHQKQFFKSQEPNFSGSAFKFDSYDPIYNLMVCPEEVKELFSVKGMMSTEQIRQRIYKMRTPLSPSSFDNNLQKMKTLSKNQDVLVQNYFKDKYINSERPSPETLSQYYRYIKGKLVLTELIEKQGKMCQSTHLESKRMTQNPIQNRPDQENLVRFDQIQAKFQNTESFGYEPSVFCSNSNSIQTPLTFVSSHTFDFERDDEEKKNDCKAQNIEPKPQSNITEDFLNSENEEEQDLEHIFDFKINGPHKNVVSHKDSTIFDEEELEFGLTEKERLYSIF